MTIYSLELGSLITGLWLLLPAGSLAVSGPLSPVVLKSKALVSDLFPVFGSGLLVLSLTSHEHRIKGLYNFESPSAGALLDSVFRVSKPCWLSLCNGRTSFAPSFSASCRGFAISP